MARSVEALSQSMPEVQVPFASPLKPDTSTEVFPKPEIRPKKIKDLTFTPRHRRILDEREDVMKAMVGDADSFGKLYDHYQPKVYRYLYHKTGNFAEAEDLTSEVFLKAWRGIGRYQPRGYTFGAWLKGIAHNDLVDHYIAQRQVTPIEEADISTNDDDPYLQVEKRAEIEQLRQAIPQLTPDQQAVVQMRLQDKDNKEIAQALSKTEGSVKVIFHRSILNLRDVMRKEPI